MRIAPYCPIPLHHRARAFDHKTDVAETFRRFVEQHTPPTVEVRRKHKIKGENRK